MIGWWPYILLVMLPSILVVVWAAYRVKSTYARWAVVDSGINLSAFDLARRLLDRQGLTSVRIEPTPGQLTDHYDPRGKVLRVSTTVADQAQITGGLAAASPRLSVAAAAVIAHEVGHAVQDHQGEPWMVARQALVPIAQLGSGLGPWVIFAGLIFNALELSVVGLLAMAGALVFTFLTLPVEIGASARGLAYVGSLGLVGDRQVGARQVLSAAAWTYVAAALAALLNFLYYLFLVLGRRD